MMKKLSIIGVVCASIVGFSACDEFLEEEPQSSLTASDFYQTEAQLEANVNYLYRTGAPTISSSASSAYIGPFAMVPGFLTGYFTNSYEGQELVCQYSRLLTRQDNTMTVSETMDEVWDACYEAINVANAAIKYIPEVSMSESTADQLMAEAKFFRAFNYFILVKTFGDVPLTTEPYEELENLYLSRTDVDEVYDVIESDLEVAVDDLPSAMFYSNGNRVTKYAAAMLLTAVYMQQGDYSNAATYARIVIDSPHSLTDNDDLDSESAYNKLRSTDGLDEVIYAFEYDGSISDSGWWPTYAFSSSAVSVFSTYSIFERVYGPIDQFLNVYEENDLRIQPNQFFHWEYTNPDTEATWSSDVAGCWYYYDEDALLNTGYGTKDQNIFRYAEALLDAAEAIAQTDGVTSEAAGYLAQIKARANMEGKTVSEITSELLTMGKEDFIEECWTERIREFPLEFKIWDDCLRTLKYPVISTTEKGSVTYVDLVGAENASGATFKSSDLLWPISINELQRNPNLTQNDGYSTTS